MPVLEKKAVLINCAECGEEIQKGMDKCPKDGSTKIKKSLVIVSKAEDDDETEIDELEDDDFEVDDEVDEDDEDLEDEEDEDDEDDDDEDEEDEDEDESEDDEDEAAELTPVGKRAMAVEVMNLSTALAERVSKIFKRGGSAAQINKAYEKVMTEFNGVMDVAAKSYLSGTSISKSSEIGGQASLIQKRVARITKEGKQMPSKKKVRPEDLEFDKLPDSVKNYITELEGPSEDEVEKRAKIYKGLSPEAAAIVAKAAETNEKNTAAQYMEIAKSFEYVPGDRDVLAKTLRTLDETDPAAYKNMIDTLTATNENLSQSSIFKTYGSAGAGGTEEEKKRKQAEDLVAKGTYKTVEQAEVAMMNGNSYRPTA